MKYKTIKLKTGQFAVASGSKYFRDTIRNSKTEADILTCEYSANWHQSQIDRCYKSWEKARENNGETIGFTDWSDALS